MHITASVFINDDDSGLHDDYERWLERLAPHEPISQYLHNRTGEDNGDAHLKRQVMGREVVVAVTGGKLDFGPWEKIFYGEFDGAVRNTMPDLPSDHSLECNGDLYRYECETCVANGNRTSWLRRQKGGKGTEREQIAIFQCITFGFQRFGDPEHDV
jgi:hypothetical protein